MARDPELQVCVCVLCWDLGNVRPPPSRVTLSLPQPAFETDRLHALCVVGDIAIAKTDCGHRWA